MTDGPCAEIYDSSRLFRESFNHVVESEPETPAVMIEGQRERDCNAEQHPQGRFVLGAQHQQAQKTDDKNHKFTHHDVHENGANEKPFLPLEDRLAVFAVVLDMEGTVDYG